MRRNILIVLLLVLASSSVSYAEAPPTYSLAPDPAGLSNVDNPHNMSSWSSGVNAVDPAYPGESVADQICVFCHTPHSAAAKSPLWSRPGPDGPVGGFPVYNSALGIKNDTGLTDYDATNPNYPSGTSRMCLSCHDGVTSIGVLLDNTMISMEGSDTVTNDTIQGIVDLSVSHPVSFNYNDSVITTLLNPAEYQEPVVDYTPLDAAGKMQCTTCHDPHEDTRDLSGYDGLPFWRHQGNGTSYIDVCNSCHIGTTATSGSPPIHNIP